MSKEAVLVALSNVAKTVKTVAAETGLSESTVRKALKALEADEQIERHDTTPTTFSKDAPYSLEGVVAQFLGHKARSAGYITKRMRRCGLTVTTPMVKSVLTVLTASGRAVAPFRSARFRKA
jgi:predicted transcriptional regulator